MTNFGFSHSVFEQKLYAQLLAAGQGDDLSRSIQGITDIVDLADGHADGSIDARNVSFEFYQSLLQQQGYSPSIRNIVESVLADLRFLQNGGLSQFYVNKLTNMQYSPDQPILGFQLPQFNFESPYTVSPENIQPPTVNEVNRINGRSFGGVAQLGVGIFLGSSVTALAVANRQDQLFPNRNELFVPGLLVLPEEAPLTVFPEPIAIPDEITFEFPFAENEEILSHHLNQISFVTLVFLEHIATPNENGEGLDFEGARISFLSWEQIRLLDEELSEYSLNPTEWQKVLYYLFFEATPNIDIGRLPTEIKEALENQDLELLFRDLDFGDYEFPLMPFENPADQKESEDTESPEDSEDNPEDTELLRSSFDLIASEEDESGEPADDSDRGGDGEWLEILFPASDPDDLQIGESSDDTKGIIDKNQVFLRLMIDNTIKYYQANLDGDHTPLSIDQPSEVVESLIRRNLELNREGESFSFLFPQSLLNKVTIRNQFRALQKAAGEYFESYLSQRDQELNLDSAFEGYHHLSLDDQRRLKLGREILRAIKILAELELALTIVDITKLIRRFLLCVGQNLSSTSLEPAPSESNFEGGAPSSDEAFSPFESGNFNN